MRADQVSSSSHRQEPTCFPIHITAQRTALLLIQSTLLCQGLPRPGQLSRESWVNHVRDCHWLVWINDPPLCSIYSDVIQWLILSVRTHVVWKASFTLESCRVEMVVERTTRLRCFYLHWILLERSMLKRKDSGGKENLGKIWRARWCLWSTYYSSLVEPKKSTRSCVSRSVLLWVHSESSRKKQTTIFSTTIYEILSKFQ